MVQLSGLLAVQGWFVSCDKEKKDTQQSILHFASVSSSKCSFTSRFHVHFDQVQSIKSEKKHTTFQKRMWQCVQKCRVSLYSSL